MARNYFDTRIYITGHKGMVGGTITRALQSKGYRNIITATHEELDLLDMQATEAFLKHTRPEIIIHAAALVGGIKANSSRPADFMYQNLSMALHVIHSAFKHQVKRLIYLGSSCVYPREAVTPIQEESLLSAPLEKTNEAYALAKICGIKLCAYYRKQYGMLFHSVQPCNIYGLNDFYHPEDSHVIPALIRRFHNAKIKNEPNIVVWGSGKPLREFLYADDLAEAIETIRQIKNPPELINIGSSEEISIMNLCTLIKDIVGYSGELVFDTTKPDGTYRKVLDNSKIMALGWKSRTPLANGLKTVYDDFLQRMAYGTLRQ